MRHSAAVDFARVATALNLPQSTLQSLSAFRARNAAAKASLSALKSQKQDIDFAHYRAVLKKNTQIVDRLEKVWIDFKPAEYDVSAQIKAIEAFESKAVRFFSLFFPYPLSHIPFQKSGRAYLDSKLSPIIFFSISDQSYF
jgi:hypothetical protein